MEKKIPGSRISVLVIGLVFNAVVVVGIVPIIIYSGYREPQTVIDLNTFNLKGPHGISIPFSEITAIDIIDLHEVPAVSIRTNGFSFLNVQRGNFRTFDGKNIRLSIHRDINPVVKIVNTRNDVITLIEKMQTKRRRYLTQFYRNLF